MGALQLTKVGGGTVFVFIQHIVAMERSGNMTHIITSNGVITRVVEHPEDILTALDQVNQ
jgi:hypothetical protein